MGERKSVRKDFFFNETLNKEILDHDFFFPRFVKMFTDLILNINKTCTLSCTAKKNAAFRCTAEQGIAEAVCCASFAPQILCKIVNIPEKA